MSEHRARKRFGQHFLHDPRIIGNIVASVALTPDDHVVEIGPGLGALTQPLIETGAQVTVVELDRDLAERLRQRYTADEVTVIQADALKTDFSALVHANRPLRVVGNLPYNISTPLIFHLLENIGQIVDLHIMVQKEVADRLVAGAGTRTYGRLSVMVAQSAEVKRLFDVGPGAFKPAPKVESSVVRIVPRALPENEQIPATFAEVVRVAFSQRRKTLRRIFLGRLDADAMSAIGIDPGARPDTLHLTQFLALSRAVQAADRCM
jgi:16S rRNA (adenine1518-N6/adenine1519-N6)-dimethyltransferase